MLTIAQQAILKADIQLPANAGALAGFIAAADWYSVALFYNALFSPPVLLWRPQIPVSEMSEVINWTDFAALTALKQNAYIAMTQGGVVNATLASVRSAFAAIFGAGSATTTALTGLAQKAGTRYEALLASGGVSSVFGQSVTGTDVQQAMLSA